MKQKAIICDIDGVLLHTEHIFKQIDELGLTGVDKWNYFNRHANDFDVEIDFRVVELVESFAKNGFRIIFLTARAQDIESQTRAKIDSAIGQYANEVFPFLLLMRPSDCVETSDTVKKVWVDLLREKYDIYCAIDDDPKNCEMFTKRNILTLQVHK